MAKGNNKVKPFSLQRQSVHTIDWSFTTDATCGQDIFLYPSFDSTGLYLSTQPFINSLHRYSASVLSIFHAPLLMNTLRAICYLAAFVMIWLDLSRR